MDHGKAPGSAMAAPASQLLCLSLHETDKIRVMNLSASSIALLRSVILSFWKRGIQSESLYGISYEFKLWGNPWRGNGEEANCARHLMAGILGFLLQRGWVLKLSTDLSKKRYDKDTLYFKQGAVPEASVRVCAMSFNESDKIRVIGGPPDVPFVVRSTIQNCWHRGLQRECLYHGVPEFKMLGNPWIASGSETMQTRMFVGQLIEALDHAGWEVYASLDISCGNKGGNDPVYASLDISWGNNGGIDDDLDSWILRTKPAKL